MAASRSSDASPCASPPAPALEGLAGAFYGWCRRRELRLQRCADCREWRHVPRPMCPGCGSFRFDWMPASGRGRVFTWTVVRRAMHPAFARAVPYAPAVIELEEGVRIVSQVVDCPPEALRVGLPVEVVFEDVSPDLTLPRFRRSRAHGAEGRQAS